MSCHTHLMGYSHLLPLEAHSRLGCFSNILWAWWFPVSKPTIWAIKVIRFIGNAPKLDRLLFIGGIAPRAPLLLMIRKQKKLIAAVWLIWVSWASEWSGYSGLHTSSVSRVVDSYTSMQARPVEPSTCYCKEIFPRLFPCLASYSYICISYCYSCIKTHRKSRRLDRFLGSTLLHSVRLKSRRTCRKS